ncbi:type IV pilus assembly protein PilW [Halopseudomonas litoralis]|uniref:Type IV pilus assembly protein PilW n=1 Tax=Halopseudomonas litoralis TaxID=797277 RepID=A0A1H1U0M7_9GAMM|nr:PilW family protein [Halopseudomonas litoralis]SDS65449.1 type IV pilus assembly protein PilW [Halopseudomonas litoralis]
MKSTQKGLTLIELMVALLLGLIFSAAAFQLLFANQRTFGLQQTLASLQEDGQMALRYIAADIRNAGRGTILQGTIPPVILDPASPNGHSQNGTNDELVVQYFGTADCQGTTSATEVEIINRYFVQGGALLCSGNRSGGTVELLNGVESFQVLYGLDTDKNETLSVTTYANASATMLDPSEAGADDAPVLVSIRLAVLLQSEELTQQAPSSATTHHVLNQRITSPSDRRIRRVFSTTVHMRNFNSEEV